MSWLVFGGLCVDRSGWYLGEWFWGELQGLDWGMALVFLVKGMGLNGFLYYWCILNWIQWNLEYYWLESGESGKGVSIGYELLVYIAVMQYMPRVVFFFVLLW